MDKIRESSRSVLRAAVPKCARSYLRQMGSVLFRFDFRRQSQLKQALGRCRTPADYFSYCKRFFQLAQFEEEILGLISLMQPRQPAIVGEIGMERGGNTVLLLHTLKPKQYIGIDIEVQNRHRIEFLRPAGAATFISASSYADQTVRKVQTLLGGRKFDLLFIDGDHSYLGVKSDFLGYRSMVAENGVIAFHDIVATCFDRGGVRTSAYTGGVPKFFARLKSYYPHAEFIRDPEQDGLGIGLIYYSSAVQLPHDLIESVE